MNESIFTLQSYNVPFTSFVDPWYLLPFGDVHKDNPNHDGELWGEWCGWGATKKRSMFIGMGDYLELFSDSERNGLTTIRLHDSSKKTLDDHVKETCKKFFEDIKFMKGKLIGMLEGNHFYNFTNGMTSTQYLCQLLDCKYLGASSFTRLTFSYARGNRSSKCDIFAHHGKGASRLVGGSLNTVQQMAECANADIFLMGHDHKKSVGMSTKLELTDGATGLHLKERKLLYGRTGSFLKGYEPDKPSYVAKALMNPTDLGTIKIELTPKLKKKMVNGREVSEKMYIDIHASL